MKDHLTTRLEWLLFSKSYLATALLCCEQMIDDLSQKEKFFIPAIYNLKHSIEIFLKACEKTLNLDFEPKKDNHDAIKILKKLKEKIFYENLLMN
ncbi:hypothetical protein COV82_06755 [Candidatus Peregrinibacteria bacterium CG11_big_fil_rev_8_21_14_0_20_46_8]|nr:MAG: hypothetical protein COV82_06755 [Candidatus Peregrinibacteria bacterium CG11_big_fil_rev_8_21_14_0_20_46_8]